MDEFITEINYDKLIEKSLKNVVVDALKIAENQGLPGEHHFYITFRTNHLDTNISASLKHQYPEEMTIVLQHQFSDLVVEDKSFSVDLSFGGILQTLTIPFDAITYFADPHAKFGLSFNLNEEGFNKTVNAEENTPTIDIKSQPSKVAETATVISIDAFRNRK